MRSVTLFAGGLVLAVIAGCWGSPDQATPPESPAREVLDFGVYWPPQDPAEPEGPIGEPFLLGKLYLRDAVPPSKQGALTLSIDLTRPSDEEHREIWNSRLAYREYGWMNRLRVWDVDEKWLWPNLPYLLRAHGLARFERYGGVDPGSGEDNDFAAVLIRAYDAASQIEQAATRGSPLVSAAWRPVGVDDVDRETIVHTARSDEFMLPMEGTEGRLAVWLIYADFMGAPVPRTWPKESEWKGGILAYFEIDWKVDRTGEYDLKVEQKTPPSGTGFDWEEWIGPSDGDERKKALATLSVLGAEKKIVERKMIGRVEEK